METADHQMASNTSAASSTTRTASEEVEELRRDMANYIHDTRSVIETLVSTIEDMSHRIAMLESDQRYTGERVDRLRDWVGGIHDEIIDLG